VPGPHRARGGARLTGQRAECAPVIIQRGLIVAGPGIAHHDLDVVGALGDPVGHELPRLIPTADQPAAGCRGVFIDTSTSNTRRYCSERCMNRANVSAFRARKRGEDDGEAKAPTATA